MVVEAMSALARDEGSHGEWSFGCRCYVGVDAAATRESSEVRGRVVDGEEDTVESVEDAVAGRAVDDGGVTAARRGPNRVGRACEALLP